jgi:hypothetical protein
MSHERSNRLACLMAAVGLSMAASAWAQQAPAAEQPKPAAPAEVKKDEPKKEEKKVDASLPAGKDILAKHVEVTGGKAAYEKIKSRKATGTVEIPAMGMNGTLSMMAAEPNKMMFLMEVQGMGASTQATDGTDVWMNNPMMGPALLEGDDKDSFLQSAMFNPEIKVDEMYKDVKTVGLEKVKLTDDTEVEAYKVELTPKKGEVETRFFNKETGMMIKSQTTAKTQMGEMTTESYYKDYTDVDGVKTPSTMTLRQAGMDIVMKFTKIEHNVDVGTAFEMPAEVKAIKDKPATAPAGEAPKAPEAPATPK